MICCKRSSSLSYGDVEQALNVLIGMGAVAPCQSEAAEKQVQDYQVKMTAYIKCLDEERAGAIERHEQESGA